MINTTSDQSNRLNIMIEWNDGDGGCECERRTQNESEWCSNLKFETTLRRSWVDDWFVDVSCNRVAMNVDETIDKEEWTNYTITTESWRKLQSRYFHTERGDFEMVVSVSVRHDNTRNWTREVMITDDIEKKESLPRI